jgi:hypothetical protein
MSMWALGGDACDLDADQPILTDAFVGEIKRRRLLGSKRHGVHV